MSANEVTFSVPTGRTQREIIAALVQELVALHLVCWEARALLGAAGASGTLAQANLDSLRALLWRHRR